MRIDQWADHLQHLGRTDARDAELLQPDQSLGAGSRGEQRLWRAVAGERVELSDLFAPSIPPEGAPILPTDGYLAIEVWTECELSAMHALWRLLRTRHPATAVAGRARLDAAVRWHLVHTQPDNATNRPWAIHVFLGASIVSGSTRTASDAASSSTQNTSQHAFDLPDPAECALYAETLLSNMLATDARSEELSRWILRDASRELRLVV